MGFVTDFGYGGQYNSLLWFRDARGNMTEYDYAAAGNVETITYADTTAEHYNYDGLGNLSTWTNGRGNTIRFDGIPRTDRGQLRQQTDSDGTTFTYNYDALGRLQSVTDVRGTTTFQYDSEND